MLIPRLVLAFAVFQLLLGVFFTARSQQVHRGWLEMRRKHPVIMLVFFGATRYSKPDFRVEGILMIVTSVFFIVVLWLLGARR